MNQKTSVCLNYGAPLICVATTALQRQKLIRHIGLSQRSAPFNDWTRWWQNIFHNISLYVPRIRSTPLYSMYSRPRALACKYCLFKVPHFLKCKYMTCELWAKQCLSRSVRFIYIRECWDFLTSPIALKTHTKNNNNKRFMSLCREPRKESRQPDKKDILKPENSRWHEKFTFIPYLL